MAAAEHKQGKWRFFCWAAAAFMVLCLWVRLAYPSYMPFIADEPLLQMVLDDSLNAGTLPIVGLGGSSIPLPYGAGALWVFAAVRAFSSSLEAIVLVHGLLYSLSLLCLIPVLRGRVEARIVWLVAWLALSSPILFFFSRMAWDNTFIVPLSSLLLLILDYLDRKNCNSILPWAALSFVAAYMLNVHLMSGPVILAAGITALIILGRAPLPLKRKLFLAGFALFFSICLITPYLWKSTLIYLNGGVPDTGVKRAFWGDGRNVWWLIQRSFIFLSFWKAHDLYGLVFPEFRNFCGSILSAIFAKDILGWLPKALAVFYVFSLPVKLFRGVSLNALQWFALLSFVLVLLVFNFLNIPTEAHYFNGVWWLGFVALALGMEGLGRRTKNFFWGITVACALINTAFIVQSSRFVVRNEGMRNFTYGVTMREMRAKISQLCREEPAPKVDIYLDGVLLQKHPIRYFNRHLPECAGKEISLASSREGVHWILYYREPSPSAALAWQRLP